MQQLSDRCSYGVEKRGVRLLRFHIRFTKSERILSIFRKSPLSRKFYSRQFCFFFNFNSFSFHSLFYLFFTIELQRLLNENRKNLTVLRNKITSWCWLMILINKKKKENNLFDKYELGEGDRTWHQLKSM